MSASKLLEVVNESSDYVHLYNLARPERREDDFVLAPQSRVVLPAGGVQIPQALTAEAFAANHLELGVGERLYYLWLQSAEPGVDLLCFASAPVWVAAELARRVPGSESWPAGEHGIRLVIGADGEPRAELVEATTPAPLETVFDAAAEMDPATIPPGKWIEYLHGRLIQNWKDFEHITYEKTEGNLLQGSWVLQTPKYWGGSAKDLPNGHSHSLGTEIRELIASAQSNVDITTLFSEPVDGLFLESIAKGIGALAAKNRPIDIRILIGNYLQYFPDTEGLLRNIERLAPNIKGSKLRIFAAGLRVTSLSWNHSKIITVDSQRAIVGGHNWWWQDYLCWAPVHDVSMRLVGPAAGSALRYCNRLWEHVDYWNRRALGIYSNDYDGPTGKIGGNSLKWVPGSYGPDPGKTSVLSLARLGRMDWGKGNQSDYSFRDAMALAKKSIKISQQDLLLVLAPDAALLQELARAILEGVAVSVVLTSPGAQSGAGTSYWTGASLQATANAVALATLIAARARGISIDEAIRRLRENFRLAPLRFSGDSEWPAQRTHEHCGQPRVARKIANHAKVWIVDDRLFYVGSQNFYPCDHQEFGYVVEGEAETAVLLESYWNPLWQWSGRASLALDTAIDLAQAMAATESP